MIRRDLMLAGQPVGTISWRQEGNRMVFLARCPMEAGYIYRVQLLGAGKTVSLGVMMPQGADFALKRTLSLGQCPFMAGGAEGVEARLVRTRPGEEPAEIAGGPLDRYRPVEADFSTGDAALDTAVHGKGDVRYLVENNLLHLAYPLTIGAESPFAPFFAATRWLETEGGSFGLLAVPVHDRGIT